MDLVSGYPLWPVVDGLLSTYPRLSEDARADVVVVGGGITGALVAHALVHAGFDTIVLDKREVGWGSTAASTSLLQYEIDVPLAQLRKLLGKQAADQAYRACRDAVHSLGLLAHSLQTDSQFENRRSLYLASRKRDMKVLRSELEARHEAGIEVELLGADDLESAFGIRRPGALLSPDAACVDSYALTHALLQNAHSRGARIFDRVNVTAIHAQGDGVMLAIGGGTAVHARHLVLATGYETRTFLKEAPARLISTYAVASEPGSVPAPWSNTNALIWEHAHPYLYLRTTRDGRIIVGGEDDDFRDERRRDAALPKKTERLAKRFHELFPDAPFDVAFSWAGTFGETADGLAYIGQHVDWPSTWFALGYGGNGITFSMIASEIIRDALLGRHNPNADLFRFDR